jgi:hypothetical protein
MIRPDYYADITIFNPDTVLDVATFENPNRTSTGIEYVLVNGVLSLEHGKVTGQLGGRPLRGPGYMGRGAAPDGLRPKGKIVGIVTSPDGWALTRATITLTDAGGKVLATTTSKREGAYELVSDAACKGCKLTAERLGFTKQEKKVDYNGSNSISFSFALVPEKARSGVTSGAKAHFF